MKHARWLYPALALAFLLGLGLVLWRPDRGAAETAAAPAAPARVAAADAAALERARLEASRGEAPAAQPGAARVSAPGRLLARLVDFHTRRPIEKAVFHARYEKGVEHSDENGEVRAFLGGRDPVQFEATAEGYCVLRGEIEAAQMDGAQVVELPLVASSPVRGVVLNEEGQPVQRANLATIGPQENELRNPVPAGLPAGWSLWPEGVGGFARSDEQGMFELRGLVPGSSGYELHVSRSGYDYAKLPIVALGAGVPTFLRATLQRTPGPPAGSIRGRTYLNDEPVEAEVLFVQAEDTDWADLDDETREYVCDSVPPGRGTLLALPRAWDIDHDAYLADPWIEGSLVELEVADQVEIVQDLWMSIPVETLSGKVTRQDGSTPMVGEVFDVYASSPLLECWAQTDAEGRFEIEVPVTGDPYRVRAGNEVVSPLSDPLRPGAAEIDLVYTAFSTFSLVAVESETGKAVTQLFVRVRRRGTEKWFSSFGPPFRAPAGPLEIQVYSRGYETALLQVEIASERRNSFVAELEARKR